MIRQHLLLLFLSTTAATASNQRSLRASYREPNEYRNLARRPCRSLEKRVLEFPCLLGLVSNEKDAEEYACELDPRDANGVAGIILPVEGLQLSEEQEAVFVSFATLLYEDGYYVDDESVIVISDIEEVEFDPITDPERQFESSSSDDLTPSKEEKDSSDEDEVPFRARPTATGDKSVIVIRTIANDGAPDDSADDLRDEIFGIHGDPLNMASHYGACSYNKFTMTPFRGDINGNTVTDGVYETTIDLAAVDIDEADVTTQLASELGANWVTRKGIDHVLYCLPRDGFTAYAYYNSHLSVYSNHWCSAPSGNMHELGHVSHYEVQ